MEKQNLNLEDIKVGEKYKLELLCIHNKEKVIVFETPTGDHIPLRNSDLECICPQTTPKYDPTRLLKKGDRVQVKRRNGRCNGKAGEYLREAFCEVAEDEEPNELVRVYHNSSEYKLDPAYLELITPVEEQEPYSVSEATVQYLVKEDNKKVVAQFCKLYHPHAKAAAEAERDRLNAEWRKEQE